MECFTHVKYTLYFTCPFREEPIEDIWKEGNLLDKPSVCHFQNGTSSLPVEKVGIRAMPLTGMRGNS